MIRRLRLLLRFACAMLAAVLVCLVVNWLLIPSKAVKLFAPDEAPIAPSSPPTTLRLVTWNLCHARGDNTQPLPIFEPAKRDARLAEMADVLGGMKPDIVVLEEVTFDSTGIGGPNQAQFLAKKLGMKWRIEQRNGDVYVPGAGHQWGTAVLSRLPITSSRFIELPQTSTWSATLGLKRKNAVLCRIALTPDRTLRLIATHLPIGKESAALHQQAVEIFDSIRRESDEPLVIAGDLNAGNESPALKWLVATGAYRTSPEGPPTSTDLTFPADQPKRTIDWIYVPASWRILTKEIPRTTASDHLPVMLTVQMNAPTHADVRYGSHERHVLDFWQAKSDKPTPLVFFIHGGGWMFGDKSLVTDVDAYLAAGISVASINYRYTSHAVAEHIETPVKAPMMDAARALQFVRSQAAAWNLDTTRIAASGRSAGACTALWLAFHDDMADAQSSDPIARESTRLWCVAAIRAQTTLDPRQMREWTPNSDYGGQAFGFTKDAMSKDALWSGFDAFLAARDRVLPWIEAYSPYAHATADDPPVHLSYTTAPAMGQPQDDPTHTANLGLGLQQHLQQLGVRCELVYPDLTRAKAFLIHHLTQR